MNEKNQEITDFEKRFGKLQDVGALKIKNLDKAQSLITAVAAARERTLSAVSNAFEQVEGPATSTVSILRRNDIFVEKQFEARRTGRWHQISAFLSPGFLFLFGLLNIGLGVLALTLTDGGHLPLFDVYTACVAFLVAAYVIYIALSQVKSTWRAYKRYKLTGFLTEKEWQEFIERSSQIVIVGNRAVYSGLALPEKVEVTTVLFSQIGILKAVVSSEGNRSIEAFMRDNAQLFLFKDLDAFCPLDPNSEAEDLAALIASGMNGKREQKSTIPITDDHVSPLIF